MVVKVLIDIREADLWKECAPYITDTEGWYVEQATLDVGDIAFFTDVSGVMSSMPAVTWERKTADDLGASQKDGRYREQRARLLSLRGHGTAIGYIIEAPPWSATLARSWCRGAFTEVHLQQTIARLQMRYTIPVFQSFGVTETVKWIRCVAKQLVADKAVFQGGMAVSATAAAAVYAEAIHIKKAANATPERIFASMLLVIPGLGKTAVDALGTATGSSIPKLLTMTEIELSVVQAGKRKLGASVARTIYAAFHAV